MPGGNSAATRAAAGAAAGTTPQTGAGASSTQATGEGAVSSAPVTQEQAAAGGSQGDAAALADKASTPQTGADREEKIRAARAELARLTGEDPSTDAKAGAQPSGAETFDFDLPDQFMYQGKRMGPGAFSIVIPADDGTDETKDEIRARRQQLKHMRRALQTYYDGLNERMGDLSRQGVPRSQLKPAPIHEERPDSEAEDITPPEKPKKDTGE